MIGFKWIGSRTEEHGEAVYKIAGTDYRANFESFRRAHDVYLLLDLAYKSGKADGSTQLSSAIRHAINEYSKCN